MENRHMVYESYYPGYSDSADTLCCSICRP